MSIAPPALEAFGGQLRRWRTHRRLSQLELAGRAEVSTRHLSFLETGKARPSREMVLHLAEVLDVPLRARNELLTGAGLAPAFPTRPLDDGELAGVRTVVASVLAGHEPNPAIVVDRCWNLVDANGPAALFLADVAPELLAPPVNVVRVSLHPDGLRRAVVNFDEYATHLLWRLRRQVDRTADPDLAALLAEAQGWTEGVAVQPTPASGVVLPLTIWFRGVRLEFFSTISVFGAPLDVTVDDLAIEAFYPSDEGTTAAMRAIFTNGDVSNNSG